MDNDDVISQSIAHQQTTVSVTRASRFVGAFRGVRGDTTSGRQRFENEEDNDENANVKTKPEETSKSRPELERKAAGKDVKSTGEARTEKKKRFKRTKADQHQRLEEESDDAEDNEEQSARKSTTQPTVTKDKGIWGYNY